MVELADIVRVAGPAYVQAHAGCLLPSQRRVLNDIVQCRTPILGGSLYRCDDCGALDYRYHSCRNRHCPKCQGDRAQCWLERVQRRLLPCDHYLLTFTLPHQLRAVARRHQRVVYAALLQHATLYLSRYVYRVALTNQRLARFTGGRVTFRYTQSRTQEARSVSLPVDAFLTRFLQHVLPRGFTKIRWYGLLSPSRRNDLDRARQLLALHSSPQSASSQPGHTESPTDSTLTTLSSESALLMIVALRCPICRRGQRILVRRYHPSRAPP